MAHVRCHRGSSCCVPRCRGRACDGRAAEKANGDPTGGAPRLGATAMRSAAATSPRHGRLHSSAGLRVVRTIFPGASQTEAVGIKKQPRTGRAVASRSCVNCCPTSSLTLPHKLSSREDGRCPGSATSGENDLTQPERVSQMHVHEEALSEREQHISSATPPAAREPDVGMMHGPRGGAPLIGGGGFGLSSHEAPALARYANASVGLFPQGGASASPMGSAPQAGTAVTKFVRNGPLDVCGAALPFQPAEAGHRSMPRDESTEDAKNGYGLESAADHTRSVPQGSSLNLAVAPQFSASDARPGSREAAEWWFGHGVAQGPGVGGSIPARVDEAPSPANNEALSSTAIPPVVPSPWLHSSLAFAGLPAGVATAASPACSSRADSAATQRALPALHTETGWFDAGRASDESLASAHAKLERVLASAPAPAGLCVRARERACPAVLNVPVPPPPCQGMRLVRHSAPGLWDVVVE